MPDTNLDKLKAILAELFMLDQADLDFGIYRVMNAKRGEITRFLDNDLLPQVRTALATVETGDRAALETEKAKAIATLMGAGLPREQAEQTPKIKELQAKIDAHANPADLENEVLSDLANFFRRYYQGGDFLALRRYKAGVYAIPYEGEEVKLHWANADQYYIKTSEYLRDYTFKLADGKRVHFKLVEADTEAGNKKAAAGQERRFILCATDPLVETDDELFIRFEYRPDAEKRKQSELNTLAAEAVLNVSGFTAWKAALATKAPTEKNPNRTVLDKHLADYTARNAFDYFIHKDIGGFLRRELDFFIKNEIMHLDDIEGEAALRVEQYLAKIKAIRVIARKVIDFLEQLENFQKKLWLKKKFVVETNWCVTLDRVAESLYPEILANDAQWQEWEKLFAISEIKSDLFNQKKSSRDAKFLQTNPYLVLDTKFFSDEFKAKLLADNKILGGAARLDEATDGLVIHSENFNALNMLQARYRAQIKCTYIDPPYNTGGDGFAYKDSYQHSSWMSMIKDRVSAGRSLLADDGAFFCSIDENEVARLRVLLETIFSQEIGAVVVQNNPKGRVLDKSLSTSHEYLLAYSPRPDLVLAEIQKSDDEVRRDYPERDAGGPFRELELRNSHREFNRETRPNLWYPLYGNTKTHEVFVEQAAGLSEILPVWDDGFEGCWTWGKDLATQDRQLLTCHDVKGRPKVFRKSYAQRDGENVGRKPKTIWVEKEFQTEKGQSALDDCLGQQLFRSPKATALVGQCILLAPSRENIVLDFFSGSGTTGHTVINLNREDGGKRKYILVEMGDHFDTVLKLRLLKVIYSKDWKDGKPVSREGSSHLFKYIRLESYEDALNNLELRRSPAQDDLLAKHQELREDYLLRYQLDVESRESASLLNVAAFANPFAYQLKIATGSVGESRPVNVDLVETFNYLLGLRVSHLDTIRGFRVVSGLNPAGEKVLVIWRNLSEKSNTDLDAFFQKQGYNTKDMEFALIYVNGDNNLENLKLADQTWKVRRTEDEFKRLMFDVRDI